MRPQIIERKLKSVASGVFSKGEGAIFERAKPYLRKKFLLGSEPLQFLANDREDGFELELPFLAEAPQIVQDGFLGQFSTQKQAIIQIELQHPSECTLELYDALAELAEAGAIINNRTTLIKGFNDDLELIRDLNLKLLLLRARPYVMFIREDFESEDFQVPREKAIEIMEGLRGWSSGMAVPHAVVITKTHAEPLLPKYIVSRDGEKFVFRSYLNKEYVYINK